MKRKELCFSAAFILVDITVVEQLEGVSDDGARNPG